MELTEPEGNLEQPCSRTRIHTTRGSKSPVVWELCYMSSSPNVAIFEKFIWTRAQVNADGDMGTVRVYDHVLKFLLSLCRTQLDGSTPRVLSHTDNIVTCFELRYRCSSADFYSTSLPVCHLSFHRHELTTDVKDLTSSQFS